MLRFKGVRAGVLILCKAGTKDFRLTAETGRPVNVDSRPFRESTVIFDKIVIM